MDLRKQYLFVLFIPLVNALAANTTEFFPGLFLTTGAVRAALVGSFGFFFIIKKMQNSRINVFVLAYLFYFLVLTFLSSNVFFSLTLYLKLFLGVIMFPIGYYYINNYQKMGDLVKVFLLALIIYIVNIIISNIFKLGSSDYLEGSFYFGTGRVNITKSMLLLVLFAPLSFFFIKRKLLIYLIYIVGLIVTVIGIKRSVLLSGLSSLIIYGFFNRGKANIIKWVAALAFFLFLFITFFPSLTDIFLQRFEARNERIYVTEESLSEEARYNETSQVLNGWINGSVKHKIFGSELFNDRFYFNTPRMLHTDYMIVLNGSGIVGIFFWFFIFLLIIKEKNKYYRYIKRDTSCRELNSLFYMFLVAQLLMSISSTIYAIDIRSILFLTWGAIIGTMRTRYYELNKNVVKMHSKSIVI